jgi:hypothetical protein
MSTQDERKAVVKAHAILNTLTPATEPDDDIAGAVRDGTRQLTTAMARALSSEAAFNGLRADAADALSAVGGSLDARTLTQETLDVAKRAVAKLHDALGRQGDEPEKIYVDPALPATLRRAEGSVDCHTLEEAVLAWMRLPDSERAQASIKVNVAGGAVYTAAEIDQLHIAPQSH